MPVLQAGRSGGCVVLDQQSLAVVSLRAGRIPEASDMVSAERFLAPARATVDRDAWDAALATGRALTQDQAITLLTSPPPSS